MHFRNSSLYRRRFNHGGKYLKGLAVLEYQQNRAPHAHLAITNPIPAEETRNGLLKHIGKFHTQHPNRSKARQIRDDVASGETGEQKRQRVLDECITKQPLIRPEGIKVQAITETPEQVVLYMLKEKQPMTAMLGLKGLDELVEEDFNQWLCHAAPEEKIGGEVPSPPPIAKWNSVIEMELSMQ